MSLAAANPGGWSLNEVLTSTQMTFLQNELLKAIDGVNGGTYTLTAPLSFAGAAVRFAADLEVLGTGQINVQSGAEINVLGGARLDVESGAGLHLDIGAELDIDADTDLNAAAVFTVHGEIALATSGPGELSVASGAIINVNSGGRVDLNNGSEMNVEGTGHIDIEGSIEVTTGTVNVFSATGVSLQSGGRLNALAGSQVIVSAGALMRIEDANELTINASAEGYRLTMTPAFHDPLVPWQPTSDASGLRGWFQFDVAARRDIWFALPVVPGDTVIDVFARVNGDPAAGIAHGGVLPTNVPTVELISVDLDGVRHVHATKNDPTLGASYDSVHNIVLQNGTTTTGTMPHLAGADPLYVRVRGEQGGSATPGLALLSISGNIIARSYRADTMVY